MDIRRNWKWIAGIGGAVLIGWMIYGRKKIYKSRVPIHVEPELSFLPKLPGAGEMTIMLLCEPHKMRIFVNGEEFTGFDVGIEDPAWAEKGKDEDLYKFFLSYSDSGRKVNVSVKCADSPQGRMFAQGLKDMMNSLNFEAEPFDTFYKLVSVST